MPLVQKNTIKAYTNINNIILKCPTSASSSARLKGTVLHCSAERKIADAQEKNSSVEMHNYYKQRAI